MLKCSPILSQAGIHIVCIFLCCGALPACAVAAEVTLGEPYEAHASSELKSEKQLYAVKQIVAPSLKTAWCEGADGDGIGEWLELSLKTPLSSSGGFVLDILPGYIKSPSAYANNNRPKKMLVRVGSAQVPIQLNDVGQIQSFHLAWMGKPVDKIRLTLLEVYPGSQFRNTCITDISIRQQIPKDYWEKRAELVRTKRVPEGYVELDWAEREASLLTSTLNLSKHGTIHQDSLGLAMGLSQGMYYSTAEGAEFLNEIYLKSLLLKPEVFLWTLDKQSPQVTERVSQAIISPSTDEFSPDEIRAALSRGVKQLDAASTSRLSLLLTRYSIAPAKPSTR